jgi:hypothetical protein
MCGSEENESGKELLPGQCRLGDALAVALGGLVDDAVKAMAEQAADYDAWYARQRWDGEW